MWNTASHLRKKIRQETNIWKYYASLAQAWPVSPALPAGAGQLLAFCAFSASYRGGSQGLSNSVILGNQPHKSSPFFLNRYHLQFSAGVFKHINNETLQRREMCVIHLFYWCWLKYHVWLAKIKYKALYYIIPQPLFPSSWALLFKIHSPANCVPRGFSFPSSLTYEMCSWGAYVIFIWNT